MCVWGHVGRGGVCFTLDFCRFLVDLGGFLSSGFAFLEEVLIQSRELH